MNRRYGHRMRWVLASTAGLLVLLATWPVLCMQGEFDAGSCKSALMVPVVGTADSADVWALFVSAPLTVASFLVVLRLARRR